MEKIQYGNSLFTDHDIYLFKEGSHFRLYEKFGAHIKVIEGTQGVCFSVWAPNAESVSVIGEFNGWDKDICQLKARDDASGIWEGFIPGLDKGTIYLYHIRSRYHNFCVNKGDPYALFWGVPPEKYSVVWNLDYDWNDNEWMKERHKSNSIDAPFSIYEIHLGSWCRVAEEGDRFLTYREIAHKLAKYVKDMGFTHVELLPVMEHPFYGSWGYQITGYFAPTSRHGTPQDFMYLIDVLHQNGIGVIFDWVPSHFPSDEYGLVYFDGTHLYEHADPRKGFHPDWKSYIFNFGRNEVKNFLISNALFWLDKYHIDGLRVDAVASMLYLDYSRSEGEWIPNEYGGRENIEAINFLKKCNETIYRSYPDVQTIAEESTAWPMVSSPTYVGGLGFGMKWNMGWMHDTLDYFAKDPIYRKFHNDQITFSIMYAFSENFILPLSHDEVVYGKKALLDKMPGDVWQKCANLRLLFGYMYGHPGKKNLFMGGEFGQWNEWDHDKSLDWYLLRNPFHQGIQSWVKDLNSFYKTEHALYETDFHPEGFEWVDFHDLNCNVISFLRKGRLSKDIILVICNFTPVPRNNYRIGVPRGGFWREVLNSDAAYYGGSGQGNLGGKETSPLPSHGHFDSLSLMLPPLGILFLKNEVE